MQKLLKMVLPAILCLIATLPATAQESALDYYKKAYESYKEKDYKAAMVFSNKSMTADKDFMPAYSLRGWLYEHKDVFDSAMADYSKAILLDVSEAGSYQTRAFLHDWLEEYDEAVHDFTQAIKYCKDDKVLPRYYLQRGNTYMKLKKYDRAIEDYEKTLKLSPDEMDIYERLSYAYFKSNNMAQVDDLYKNAYVRFNKRKNRSLLPDLYFRQAIYYDKIVQYDKAIACYTNANIDQWTNVLNKRAYDYRHLNQFDLAIADYRKAIHIFQFDSAQKASYHVSLATCYVAQKRYETALLEWDTAIALVRYEENALWDRARLYTNVLNNKEKAAKDFEILSHRDSAGGTFYSAIGKYYLGHKDEAEKDIKSYINQASKHIGDISNTYYNAACYYAIINDEKNAVQNLDLSLAHGFTDLPNLKIDVDLNNIRGTASFKALMEKYDVK